MFLQKITDKAFLGLQYISTKLNNHEIKKPHMINFVCGYIILVFTLFIAGWGYMWWIKGIPDLPMLLSSFNALTAPAFLAILKFITENVKETMIDLNNNGIPDELENLEENTEGDNNG